MIRPALPEDAAAIAAIWNPVIRDTAITFTGTEKTGSGLRALMQAKDAAGEPMFVAEAAGRVAGFATWGPFRSGTGYRQTAEHSVILDPAAHGQGLGRALMRAVEDHARGAGIHAMIAAVSAENPAGIAFHAAVGYRRIALLPEVGLKFGRRIDLVLMQKILA